MHHQHFSGNYGLYFLWWDRWMGTLQSDYDKRFEEVKSRTLPEKGMDTSSLSDAGFNPVKTSRTV